MNWNRILSGSPEHRKELIAAGLLVAIWFAMDTAQWVDWVASKINPPPHQALCIPLPIGAAMFDNCGSRNCTPPLTQNDGGSDR